MISNNFTLFTFIKILRLLKYMDPDILKILLIFPTKTLPKYL